MDARKFTLKACGHVCAHFERSVKPGHYSNTDIDSARSHTNYNLGPHRDNQVAYIKKMMSDLPHQRAYRKDAIVMVGIVVNAPVELPGPKHDLFFSRVYDFLVNRYGSLAGFDNKEDVVVSCYRHQDETTDHIHFAFIPIINCPDKNSPSVAKQRLCAKEVICRDDLRSLHKDLQFYLDQKDLEADNPSDKLHARVLNGRTQRDASGRALSIRELKKRTRQFDRKIDNSFQRRRF